MPDVLGMKWTPVSGKRTRMEAEGPIRPRTPYVLSPRKGGVGQLKCLSPTLPLKRVRRKRKQAPLEPLLRKRGYPRKGRAYLLETLKFPLEESARKGVGTRGGKRLNPPFKVFRTVAVSIAVNEGSPLSYRDVMVKAKKSIPLADLKIDKSRVRKTQAGALLIEIPDREASQKADRLRDSLEGVLGKEGVRVVRPVRNAELRFRGLEPSVTSKDVAEVISEVGKCLIGQVRVGEIWTSFRNYGSVWARCPITASIKVARARKVRVG